VFLRTLVGGWGTLVRLPELRFVALAVMAYESRVKGVFNPSRQGLNSVRGKA